MKSNFSTQCKSKSMVHFYINHKSNRKFSINIKKYKFAFHFIPCPKRIVSWMVKKEVKRERITAANKTNNLTTKLLSIKKKKKNISFHPIKQPM